MPRSTRERLLRKMDQAINDCDRVLANLQYLATTYDPVHPELTDKVEGLAQITVSLQRLLTRFKVEDM